MKKIFYFHPIKIAVILILFGFLFFTFNSNNKVKAQSAIFVDSFNTLNEGAINGQNGWATAGSGPTNGTWLVQSQQLSETVAVDGAGYISSVLTQTSVSLKNVNVSVDFQASASTGAPALWARRSSSIQGAQGYQFISIPSGWCFLYYTVDAGSFTLLNNFPADSCFSLSLTDGNWYTAEFQVVDDASGNPVLSAWVYPQGTTRPVSPNKTYTDTGRQVPAGYAGLGTWTIAMNYDNFSISGAGDIPSPPTNLQVVKHKTKIDLSWSAPLYEGSSSITDYVIKYRTGSDPYSTFSHSPSASTSITVDGLSASTTYDLQIYAVNSLATSSILTGSTTTLDRIVTITTPERKVAASSTIATLTVRSGCSNNDFYIPYIQTSSSLSVAAAVDSEGIPAGGSTKFVLDEGLSTETVSYDQSSPFAVTFTNVAKGEHTLNVYIVDSANVVYNGGSDYSDAATKIGIGDIYVAAGDSTTAGIGGTIYTASIYPNWTVAPVKSNDNRNFPQCYANTNQVVSYLIELNNALESAFGYPVFIINKGLGGATAGSYLSDILSPTNASLLALNPNGWLVHLGINDFGVTNSSTFQANMQAVINKIINDYHASAQEIYLASPIQGGDWPDIVSILISSNTLIAGPLFNNLMTYYGPYSGSDYFADSVHPSAAGYTRTGDLWAISLTYPKNVTTSQSGSTVTLNWDSLSFTGTTTLAGYKVKYGTTSGVYTTVDVGNVTTTSFTDFTAGQTYYFAVSAYDNDSHVANQTRNSPEISFNVASVTVPPTEPVDNSSSGGGGGGMPSSWSNPPVLPVDGFKILINSGAGITSNRIVTLNFTAGSDIKKMAISLTGDFSVASQEDYLPTKQFDLCSKNGAAAADQTCPNGLYTVYAKFYTQYGVSSGVVSAKINLLASSANTISTNIIPVNTVQVQPVNSTPSVSQNLPSAIFTRSMFFGVRSADVRRLQILLASKPEIYPEGRITGNFATLTRKAVQRFQLKYHVVNSRFDRGFGVVGPATRAKLKEVFLK